MTAKDLYCIATHVDLFPGSEPKACLWSEVQKKCVCCSGKQMFDYGIQKCINPRQELPIIVAPTPKQQTPAQKKNALDYLKSVMPNINSETAGCRFYQKANSSGACEIDMKVVLIILGSVVALSLAKKVVRR